MRKEIIAVLMKRHKGVIPDGLVSDLTALFESKLEEKKNTHPDHGTYNDTSAETTNGLSDHEKLRREVWSRAYVGNRVIDGSDSMCCEFADQALEAFDNKFKSEE